MTLLGGGPVAPDDLAACLQIAPALVAADGGADTALAAGHVPDAVIGDMDSLSPEGRAALPSARLHPVAEQDSTDFEKCLTRIAAPLVLATGVTGARLDHALAVFNALVRHPHRRCVVLGGADAIAVAPPTLALDLPEGTRVSLFPFGAVEGEGTGLRWPIDGIAFAPDGRVGTSNMATGSVRLAFSAPAMLVMVPRAGMAALIEALLGAPGWPGP